VAGGGFAGGLDAGHRRGDGAADETIEPVVVGAGPAGLMAALALAEAGLAPLVIERGKTGLGQSPIKFPSGDLQGSRDSQQFVCSTFRVFQQ